MFWAQVVKGACKGIVCDLYMMIEGQADDELPERVSHSPPFKCTPRLSCGSGSVFLCVYVCVCVCVCLSLSLSLLLATASALDQSPPPLPLSNCTLCVSVVLSPCQCFCASIALFAYCSQPQEHLLHLPHKHVILRPHSPLRLARAISSSHMRASHSTSTE